MTSSVYELINPLHRVRKQRFLDWFSGSINKNWWTETIIAGGSVSMLDGINGGLRLQSGNVVNAQTYIDFNGIEKYSHTGSVIIGVGAVVNTTFIGADISLEDAANSNFARMRRDTDTHATDFFLRTKNGTTTSDVQGTFTDDQLAHNFKLELKPSSATMWIDGVLDIIKTNHLPTASVSPAIRAFSKTTAKKDYRIRYVEAYNT